MNRLLSVKEVLSIVGCSRSSLYTKIADGQFPAPVAIGHRSVRWRETDLQEWIDALQTKQAN